MCVCMCAHVGGACRAYCATALHCAQQSNLSNPFLADNDPALQSLLLYTHFEVITQISVSACARSL